MRILFPALIFLIILCFQSCEKQELEFSESETSTENHNLLKSTSWSGHIQWYSGTKRKTKGSTKERINAVKFQNKTIYFYKGSNTNNLYYSFGKSGGNFYEIKVPNEASKDAPAVVVYKNRLYIAFRGETSERIYIKFMNANGVWSGHVALNEYTPVAPALAASDNYLYLIYKGSGTAYKNKMKAMKFNENGLIKSGWIPYNEIRRSCSPCATFANGKLYIGYAGRNLSFYYAWANENLNWTGATKITSSVEYYNANGYNTWQPNMGIIDQRVYFTVVQTKENSGIGKLYTCSWIGEPKVDYYEQLYSSYYISTASTSFSPFIVEDNDVNDYAYAYFGTSAYDDIKEIKGLILPN